MKDLLSLMNCGRELGLPVNMKSKQGQNELKSSIFFSMILKGF